MLLEAGKQLALGPAKSSPATPWPCPGTYSFVRTRAQERAVNRHAKSVTVHRFKLNTICHFRTAHSRLLLLLFLHVCAKYKVPTLFNRTLKLDFFLLTSEINFV